MRTALERLRDFVDEDPELELVDATTSRQIEPVETVDGEQHYIKSVRVHVVFDYVPRQPTAIDRLREAIRSLMR